MLYTDEQCEKWAKEYLAGKSLTQIAKENKIDRGALSRNFKKRGIEIVNRWNETKFNQYVFDVIDSQEKAYWLGFLYADGYISSSPLRDEVKSHYVLEVSLKGSDADHLRKFNKFLKHKKDLVKFSYVTLDGVKHKRCRLQVTNKHLWTVLNNYGCTPNKSLTLKFPDKTIFKSEDLIRHFIRGYFDGDGSISYKFSITFSGNEDFLTELIPILNTIKIEELKVSKDSRSNNCLLYIKSKYNGIFLDYIYNDSIVYLDRKYELYLKYKNCRLNK